jgi:RecJ-like exonuclease
MRWLVRFECCGVVKSLSAERCGHLKRNPTQRCNDCNRNKDKSITLDLAAIDPDINYIRFRIISEDGLKTSQWSPIYVVDTSA